MKDLLKCDVKECFLCGRMEIIYEGICGSCDKALLDEGEDTNETRA